MKLGVNEDFGDGKLTKGHTVLLNGKKQFYVIVADNLEGYVDVMYDSDSGFVAKRKFGSIIFLLNNREIRDRPKWR